MDDAVALSKEVGAKIAELYNLPVFLYEKSASAPYRENLAAVRKGEFEGMAEKIKQPEWHPDFGPAERHATAGTVAVGARMPLVAFNIGSVCHLDTVGTMQFSIDWGKLWKVPNVLKETGARQKEMEHMGAAYMAEGIVTLAGSRLYTSAAYTEEDIDDVIQRFDKVLSQCKKL